MNRPTCETCPFWDKFSDTGRGGCRRRSPQVDAAASERLENGPTSRHFGAQYGHWPTTGVAAWCGEHPQFQAWIEQGAQE